MTDLIQRYHRSILFVVLVSLGTILILSGAFIMKSPGMMAFGAAMFGAPELRILLEDREK